MSAIGPLLIATTNAHKLVEIEPILAGVVGELLTLAHFPEMDECPETGSTFRENARAKALYYAHATGAVTVAEDSGLEVDALGGAPGVHSARFNGASYPEKFDALYARLRAGGHRGSSARFVCAVALVAGGDVEFETRATIEGQLAPVPAGSGGFGYDPILYYPPLDCTLAQISTEQKSRISARGQAFRALRDFLVERRSP